MVATQVGKAVSAQGACIRSVVYSMNVDTGEIINLNNDVLNLDGFVDYTITQYLEDRAGEGVSVVSISDSLYRFSDGVSEILYQQIEGFSSRSLPSAA